MDQAIILLLVVSLVGWIPLAFAAGIAGIIRRLG